ncbi:hypothetical protein EV189_3162 [Motilibacter rhizosphaerae]|uniref:Uncharacterized protein n=1 Tax=Motilibacter rhizosphaerae TaxID=598652 RepID=A0A4Q7NFS4_9ACTN|nr:hypothetical protein [Motilibacter rhizosphaerae]RZS82767.1 hypothetical protein EV189_3162 [Motilibacter rhizosphaerae]
MPSTATPVLTATGPYGLVLPDLDDVRESVCRVDPDGEAAWTGVLARAGLSGAETDRDSLERALRALEERSPVGALCARALRIRLNSYDHLAHAQALVRSTA